MCIFNQDYILPLAKNAFKNNDYLSTLLIYKIFKNKNQELKNFIDINIKRMNRILQIKNNIHTDIEQYNNIELENQLKNISLDKQQYLYDLLWRGYSNIVIDKIKHIDRINLNKDQSGKLKFNLFKFFYASNQYEDALEVLDDIKICPKFSTDILLIKVLCYIKNSNIDKATECYNRLQTDVQHSAVGQFIFSTLMKYDKINNSDEKRLKIINNIYKKYGLSELTFINNTKGLKIYNICSKAAKPYTKCKYKVSVIIPAYNAQNTISTSINSILSQTWRNIEVIVVDDCSNDNTANIVKTFIKKDNRIHLIQHSINKGCYPTRNDGLAYATGDFITIHDSDDWSHPQKIAIQVNELVANNNAGNYSYCVLTNECLEIVGSYIPFPLFRMNSSSFLVRRNIINQVGGWDNVRLGGDTELIERIRKAYGQKSITPISMHLPLSFILSTTESLTRTKNTSLLTLSYFNSSRCLYRQFYKYNNKCIKNSIRSLKSIKNNSYDFIIVTDFSMTGGTLHYSMNYMEALSKNKYSVAVLHWARHDLKIKGINNLVFDICYKYNIDILTISDSVKTKNLIFYYPMPLRTIPDFLPTIASDNIFIVCSQFYKKYINDKFLLYNPNEIHVNIEKIFKKFPKWVAISEYIKQLMTQSKDYPNIHNDIWFPPIDCNSLSEKCISWEGDKRLPIVGRHSRDSIEKWPDNVKEIKSAYLVNSHIKVRLMGGASIPLKLLGSTPKNWDILKFNEISVADFCSSIDFLIHFPNQYWIEAFGRIIIDAMLFGKVVILPPVFKRTFGDSALYCTYDNVECTINKVWSDKNLYIETAKKAINFVKHYCSYENVIHRFDNIS